MESEEKATAAPIPAGLLKAVCEVGSFAGHGLQVMPTVLLTTFAEYLRIAFLVLWLKPSLWKVVCIVAVRE